MKKYLCALMLLSLMTVSYSPAAVPKRMNYQGKLTAPGGTLVAHGAYDMVFSLYDAETGGTEEWTETWDSGTSKVQVTNGLCNVALGTHVPVNLPFDERYWLEMRVKNGGSYETLLPRQPLASAAYAFRAEKVTDGAVTAASLDVPAIGSDGKVAGISSTTFSNLSGASLTGLNGSAIASGTVGASYIENSLKIPVGSVISFAGSSAPSGWLLCQGQAVSRTVYAELFAVLGTTYGSGDGSTTFNLPDGRGRGPMGYNSADASFDALGETGGAKTHTLTTTEMPVHTHVQNAHAHTHNADKWYGTRYATNWSSSGPGIDVTIGHGDASIDSQTATNQNTGGGAAHNNLQPYITWNYIIRY